MLRTGQVVKIEFIFIVRCNFIENSTLGLKHNEILVGKLVLTLSGPNSRTLPGQEILKMTFILYIKGYVKKTQEKDITD
mgnify:CR=1 FL=1